MKYVGIDYHKRYSVVCIIDETGRIVAEQRIDHAFPERFGQLLGEHAPCQAAFEATMNWGWLGIAAWLLAFDVARRTVKNAGLTRFIAVCLIAGYLWLAVAGVLALLHGGVPAGFAYDAMLHAVFVGFVISMIFGHAPVIFPAVTGRTLPYSPWFYGHLALLHLSLLVRTAGDLSGQFTLRKWGGLLNAAAILLFLALTARGALMNPKRAGAHARRSGRATGQ